MQYRQFARTGKPVSALGFGCMRLPRDHEESVALLHRGMELGLNYFDTAMGYVHGESEIMLGKAIQGRRDQVYLSTKNAVSEWTNEAWRRNLDQSLEKLNTDYLDFYALVHGLTWDDFEHRFSRPGGGLEAAQRARDEGLYRHAIFSTHDSPEGVIKLLDTDLFEGMIIQYNLLDRRSEPAIAHAREKGISVFVMGPVAGGRLAHRSERIADMAGAEVSSIPDLALRFVLANPGVTCALSGMSDLQMLEDNVATASREEPLSAQEWEDIHAAAEQNERLAQLYCTGCRYCLPCPEGVAIPEIFSAMNYHRVWGLTDLAREMYARLGPDRGEGQQNAAACVECGQCEDKCPQDIPIVEQLKEAHEALSD